ncbi:MAG: zinc-ribbon domain-containing protein [Candidatus Thorarchaeota archaeon]
MSEQLQCPNCGMKLGKGSTFCINCGHRIPNGLEPLSSDHAAHETVVGEPITEAHDEGVLPDLDESELGDIDLPMDAEADAPSLEETSLAEELSWDEVPVEADTTPSPMPQSEPVVTPPDAVEVVPKAVDIEDLSQDGEEPEIKEGMPFKEVEPPRVVAEEMEMTSAIEHLFPDEKDAATIDAVAHLFPEGRGSTSSSFIDVIVGKPSRVGISAPLKELDTPACPSCGAALSSDGFEYPPYVFEAMAKARMEQGERLLKEDDHEKAIEFFEIAKVLFERAGNEKGVAESTKRVDLGYDLMAKFHFDQGEAHLKEKQYEWAVVQFRKARELYMFSTDAKKRARCSQKVRESYALWGKCLEDDGDALSKGGNTREALLKYQEAAAKYREAGASKRLKGLEKKIRKA